MNFTKYLSEVDGQTFNRIGSIDNQQEVLRKVQRAVSDINLTMYGEHVYMVLDGSIELVGFFIYQLNKPNDRYQVKDDLHSEMDYYYIGSFVYNIETNQVKRLKEQSTPRYLNPNEGIKNIIQTLSATPVGM